MRVKAWKAAIGGTGTVIAVTVPARVGVSSEERVSCRCMSVVSMCVVAHLGGHVVGRRFMGGYLMGRHLMVKISRVDISWVDISRVDISWLGKVLD